MLMAQNQQAIAHVNDMTQQIKTKQIEQQGKISIAQLQERTKIVVALIQSKDRLADIEAEKELALLGDAHDAGKHAVDTQAAQLEQQAQRMQDQQSQASDQAHQQGQQASQQGADAQAQAADHSQQNLQTAMQAATQPAGKNGSGGQ